MPMVQFFVGDFNVTPGETFLSRKQVRNVV